MSLRYAGSGGHCVECIRLKSLAVPAEKKKQWSDAYLQRIGKDEICRRNQERYANMTPEQRQARVEYKRQVRERLRQQGLTASGRQPVNASALVPKAELCRMAQERRDRQRAAAKARRQEREAQRAMREQDPEWQAKHKEEKRMNQLIRYALDEDFRLYNREKSKRRKATIKERHAVRVKSRDIRARFAQFNGCAYCGTHGDMHMDHFIPLARGGTHALGNLVPACPSCNYSKTDHDPEQWYRAQPFFTEKRWRKILQVLCVKRGSPLQLALL
jgi:5-methylcytosine-specific restriction endonuclease McrA